MTLVADVPPGISLIEWENGERDFSSWLGIDAYGGTKQAHLIVFNREMMTPAEAGVNHAQAVYRAATGA